MLEHYDAPRSLPAIAPRPLLIVSGACDPRCPVRGLRPALRAAERAYRLHGASDSFGAVIQDGVGHEVSPEMDAAVEAFFIKQLKPAAMLRAVVTPA